MAGGFPHAPILPDPCSPPAEGPLPHPSIPAPGTTGRAAWSCRRSHVSTLADGGPGSLRDAVAQANATRRRRHHRFFQPGQTGTIALTGGELDLADDLAITGPGADKLTVSGSNLSRVFKVESGKTVNISGLTIKGGNPGSGYGGGIDNFGTLTVSNSAFTSNSATLGGGLDNERGGTATVSGCSFTSNSATVAGGGLFNAGTATVSGSSFTSNSASLGGGLFNASGGTATVSGSSFTSNSASNSGGGLFNESGGTATVSGSSFTSNSAAQRWRRH